MLFLGITFQVVKAQSPVDTLPKVHSIKRATNLSTFLPGAGQVYNHKAWKVPIIYAGFGITGYLIHFNNVNYKKYNSALIYRLDGDSTTNDSYSQYSEANLRTLSDYYHRNRDFSIIITGIIYVLNIIDAHVDAHLFTFNVDDNLSLEVMPTLLNDSFNNHASNVPGINFNLKF